MAGEAIDYRLATRDEVGTKPTSWRSSRASGVACSSLGATVFSHARSPSAGAPKLIDFGSIGDELRDTATLHIPDKARSGFTEEVCPTGESE